MKLDFFKKESKPKIVNMCSYLFAILGKANEWKLDF